MKKYIVFLFVVLAMLAMSVSAYAANTPDLTKYTVSYSTEGDTLVITNTYTTEKKDIPVSKVWNDDSDRDKYRPTSVCVELKANNVVVDNHTLTGTGNTWTYTFTDKVVYNKGEEINYSVAENGTTCTALPVPTNENTCLLAGGSWASDTCTMPTPPTPAP